MNFITFGILWTITGIGCLLLTIGIVFGIHPQDPSYIVHPDQYLRNERQNCEAIYKKWKDFKLIGGIIMGTGVVLFIISMI